MSLFFSVLTSPNSTEITKLVLNNNTSICLRMLFAMISKVRKKRKNFKINHNGGRLKKNSLKSEDLTSYRKTWQVWYCSIDRSIFLFFFPGLSRHLGSPV